MLIEIGDRRGTGAVLQIGRSLVRFQMVSLEFFIDIILPIALWPWGRLSLWQKWVPGGFPGGKGGRCVGLATLPPSCAVVVTSGNLNFLEPSGPLQACNGTALPFTDRDTILLGVTLCWLVTDVPEKHTFSFCKVKYEWGTWFLRNVSNYFLVYMA